jgi:hypothetical protein
MPRHGRRRASPFPSCLTHLAMRSARRRFPPPWRRGVLPARVRRRDDRSDLDRPAPDSVTGAQRGWGRTSISRTRACVRSSCPSASFEDVRTARSNTPSSLPPLRTADSSLTFSTRSLGGRRTTSGVTPWRPSLRSSGAAPSEPSFQSPISRSSSPAGSAPPCSSPPLDLARPASVTSRSGSAPSCRAPRRLLFGRLLCSGTENRPQSA